MKVERLLMLLASIQLAAVGCKSSQPRSSSEDQAKLLEDDATQKPPQADTTQKSQIQEPTPGTFKLYKTPSPVINPACDIFLSAELTWGSTGSWMLRVENRVEGPCEIHIEPSRRTFVLSKSDGGCQSHVLAGGDVASASGWGVTLTDHRQRTCADLPPALLILDYKSPTGTIRWFGNPAP
jgi:hypothetical protein